ncbi:hypothetical protein PAXRUDRAFT_163899 [Paxillus rubicundulus Ve08.2h10]|uniref:Unplaced genomic scaffold scaffold_1752, whole genome shotgun sequence n=1 Tax=Paxillus rubicundulus Ve08.2h10 TaxID=930991 RepID=A0A0D0DJZ4_9AGAM|nr:hypothetical protein PAXRUDRAFT_163899 [Paxillus rubicundulus Ve08.2h10]
MVASTNDVRQCHCTPSCYKWLSRHTHNDHYSHADVNITLSSDDGSDSDSDSDMDGSHSSLSHPQRASLESASGANEVEAMDTGSIKSDEGSTEPLHEADEMVVNSGSETHLPQSASKEYEDSSSADLDSDNNSSSPPGQNLDFDKAEDVHEDLCMSLEEIEDQLHVWLGPAIDEEFYNIFLMGWHQVMILSLMMIVIIFEPSNSKLPQKCHVMSTMK